MRQTYLISVVFVLLISILVYNIFENYKKTNNFFDFHTYVSNIVVDNSKLNSFIESPIDYKNFDDIQSIIVNINQNMTSLDSILKDGEFKNNNLMGEYTKLDRGFVQKIEKIEKLKSYFAILNNSYRTISSLINKINDNKYIFFYRKIASLSYNPEISPLSLKNELNLLNPVDADTALFKLHSRLVIENYLLYEMQKNDIYDLHFDKRIKNFEDKFSNYIKSLIESSKQKIFVLIIFLIFFLILFILYSSKIVKNQLELKRFKNAVENSDNNIVITDYNKQITYANMKFLDLMGYKLSDVIGKSPAMFSAHLLPKEYYKEMNRTIYSGKNWSGEFINKSKKGEILYEKASIIPIKSEDGEIKEFVGIKLDITKEKELLNSLKDKDHRLTQQARMVVMNEILNSIAHQWRQPLSVISTAASGMKIYKEFGKLDDEAFEQYVQSIMDNSQYLSSTIDNFKSFFKTGNEITLFDLSMTFEKAFRLLEYKLSNDKIKYIFNGEKDIRLKGIENDLIQVFVNIFTNSLDVLVNQTIQDKFIIVDIEKDNEFAYIYIKDNGGGIKNKYLNKVFEPYFSTKYNSQGTGMGLYTCFEIVTNQFNGKISLYNSNFKFDDKDYRGVEIRITLPLIN